MIDNIKKGIATGGAILALGGGGTVVVDSAVNPYNDRGTHQELSLKSDIPQGEKVKIHKDKAQMDMVFWNDEQTVSVIPQIPRAASKKRTIEALGVNSDGFNIPADRKLFSKKLEFKSGNITSFIEPKEGNENEFDIDFTLDSKPDTNVFEYKIAGAEDFDFFYQPTLTQEEIDQGAKRPDNVVGSYAVYHKTKANHIEGQTNYGTGKAFHIYRPKAIDANGNETWANLDYKEGILSVEVPQEFLDNAVYPVRVDPTFGYTTMGAGNTGFTNYMLGESATSTSSGTPTSISIGMGTWNAGSKVKGAIYKYSDNSFIVTSEERTTGGSGSPVWYTFNIADSPAVVAETRYKIFVWGNNSSTRLKFDSVGGGGLDGGSVTYGDWPSTKTSSDSAAGYSIYVTYTADTPPTSSSITSDLILFE